ncbi:MAG TPA: hypothetical protein VKV19_10350 [Ktedonobacteraceae bacterium]|nr:hypothetical protein [Ktedonobacteraceae bacterium]
MNIIGKLYARPVTSWPRPHTAKSPPWLVARRSVLLAVVFSQWWGHMCSIPLPDGDAPSSQRRLRKEWSIEIPVSTRHNRHFICLSLQGYNSPADVARLLTVLEAIFADEAANA